MVLAMLAADANYDIVGVVDTGIPRSGETILGVPVIGGVDRLASLRKEGAEAAFVALGEGAARAAAQAALAAQGYALPSLVHPTAFVDPTAQIGAGTHVCAFAFIGPGAVLGDGVIVNTHSAVDHESRVEDFATLSPAVAVAGRCLIGSGAFLGIGAKVSHGLKIGAMAQLGAGAVALTEVPPGVLAIGIPARLKQPTGKR